MQLSEQVCTQSQGEKLQELGVDYKPLLCYCHVSNKHDDGLVEILPTMWKIQGLPDLATTWIAPAFTVAELGVMLPTLGFEFVKSNNGRGKDFFWLSGHYWKIRNFKIENEVEAEARAEMLIYLLENKTITPEEVNQRLTQSK